MRHWGFVRFVEVLAEELGYGLVYTNPENKPGEPDLIIKNPKNGRQAYVEVEVTFQQQVGHQTKMLDRWNRLRRDKERGEDSVILVIGARRRDLVSLCKRAGIPAPEKEYGVSIFSCQSYYDPNEIRAILIRCLDDE